MDWEARYQARQTGWERADPNPAFLAWRARGALRPGRVLVPCAGRSPEPALLAQVGFAVTVLDIAPSAIAAQRAILAEHAGAECVEADLFAWAPPTRFDAIYDQTALCALPPDLLAEYETRLADWLLPGGGLFALFMQTGRSGGPPFDCPLDAMRLLFPATRWTWPERLEPAVTHPNAGTEQPVLLLRR